jgi:adenylosuccinate lyase
MEAYSTSRSIFKNISPLDHRYSISEEPLFNALIPWVSEEASVKACVKAEIALVIAHLSGRGELTAAHRAKLEKAGDEVDPAEVYAEEEKTRHNIRALVNVLKNKLLKKKASGALAPLVHLGATSVDILDTSLSWRVRGVTREVLLPELKKLELLLCDFTEREAETPQVGRTHGQHAVPITVGFAMAEYVSRLGKSILEIERLEKNLKGKLAGAVGAYNATAMIVKDPEELERLYLAELGLEPSEHSTQLVEPEYLLRLLLEFNTAFGIIANLADDLRNLQRSEIGELREGFAAEQVGSSTMPQKRNPWNSEHVKSLWKAFMPRVITFFMDQVSEHQRDLSNSASQRFIADYIAGFALAVSRMAQVIQGLGVDRERLLANLKTGTGGALLAEPAYILLAESGVSDAHEVIRKITLAMEEKNLSFAQALAEEKETLSKIAAKMVELGLISTNGAAEANEAALEWFSKPEQYCGLAVKKARDIAAKYKREEKYV